MLTFACLSDGTIQTDVFRELEAALRFCRVVDELHNSLFARQRMGERVSLAERRKHFLKRVVEL